VAATALTFDETLNVAASTPIQSMEPGLATRSLTMRANSMTRRPENYALMGD